MIGDDHNVRFVAQAERFEFLEDQGDLTVVVANGGERFWCARSQGVLSSTSVPTLAAQPAQAARVR